MTFKRIYQCDRCGCNDADDYHKILAPEKSEWLCTQCFDKWCDEPSKEVVIFT